MIELVVTLAIAAIISSVSVPSFLSWRENYRAKAAARQVVSAMQRARVEAIKLNTDVSLVLLNDKKTIQIFDSTGTRVSEETVADGVSLSSNFSAAQLPLPSGKKTTFNSRGLTGDSGTVTITSAATKEYSVVLSGAGHVRITTK